MSLFYLVAYYFLSFLRFILTFILVYGWKLIISLRFFLAYALGKAFSNGNCELGPTVSHVNNDLISALESQVCSDILVCSLAAFEKETCFSILLFPELWCCIDIVSTLLYLNSFVNLRLLILIYICRLMQ